MSSGISSKGWTDGLPVVPPTRGRVDEFVAALGGEPHLVECKVPPRHGSLTREVLAINMIMAGCKPEYAPVVRAAMLALTAKAFNLNGVQATTHMAAPLLIVNGPVARTIGMNGDCNAFGSGNRANATIGRALRLVLLNVGGGRPGDLDKSTLGHPGKYTYCVAENEAASPWAPYHVEKGFGPDDSTVFVLAAEPPHSVTNHVANDPEGILDSICSAMSTIANNNAVSSGHCAVIIGPEHARTIAGKGWTRHDVRSYLHMNAHNLFSELTFNERYGKIYNRNLPRWYKREQGSRIPVVPDPDHIHLFVVGGEAGRFSAFIPGWGHMSSPVLRSIESDTAPHGADLRRRHLLSVRREISMMTNEPDQIVFDPRGVVEAELMAPAPRARDLNGLRLGVLDNTKWNANRLLRKTVALLGEQATLAAVNYYRKESFSKDADPALIERLQPTTTSC